MIDIKERPVLNGLPQAIHIKGEETKPVLLCLHGGPGIANRHFVMQLTEYLDTFLLVAWDQRGTAGSYRGAKAEDLTISQLVEDAAALVEYLCKKFNREKVFVMGGSWGSLLGTRLLQAHPEHIYALIGFGQVVNIHKNELISWQFCLDEAQKAGNEKDVETLKRIGPPEMGCYKGDVFDSMLLQRNIMMKYGGYSREQGKQSYWDAIIKPMFLSGEYTLSDLYGYVKGCKFVLKTMWREIGKTDFPATCTKFEAPIFILDGRLDYNTPSELVGDWFEKIEAPRKELHWFEKSGHNPMSDEPEKFIPLVKELCLSVLEDEKQKTAE